nr:hypothetical protein Iba_chr03aCG10850 [Ipomoea batatas]
MEHAPKIASKKSRKAVHTHTLKVQARKSEGPKSFRSFAKLNIKVYIKTVGSATPKIKSGCPPKIEWITPQSAVDARVWTAVIIPSVFLSSCSPKDMTGIADAKKIYVVGARILQPALMPPVQSCL